MKNNNNSVLSILCCFTFLVGSVFTQTVVASAFDSADVPEQNQELKILRIIPEGDDVAAARQIVFTFDRKVVPVGRMERDSKDIPITITPKLKCEWRWINTNALACQLRNEDAMVLSTKYQVVVKPGIKTESGLGMKVVKKHSFITQRPKVTYTRFVNWLSPSEPILQVTFNQPVTKFSVEQSLKMSLLEDSSSALVDLEIFPDKLARELPSWMNGQQQKPDDQLTKVKSDEARRVWLIKSKLVLPLNNNIAFDVKPGLVSSHGAEKGV
ncbi:MAG: large extracellular alpha-helical protein, partial [Thiohalomonadales bacterium]